MTFESTYETRCSLFEAILDLATKIEVCEPKGLTCNENWTLTDLRSHLATQVISNVFKFKGLTPSQQLRTKICHADNEVIVGPVIDSISGKKDHTLAKEYTKLRMNDVKLRQKQEISNLNLETTLTRTVINYDLLHVNLIKPVQVLGNAKGPSTDQPDPCFRESIKVIYNRSRIVNILHKFDEAVKSQQYSPLPDLHQIDLNLLTRPEELELIKYLTRFFTIINSFHIDNLHLIPAKLWQYLLHLSQTYSVYYGRCRTLCDTKHPTLNIMYARIWLLKTLLEIYNSSFHLLDVEPVDYL